MDREALTPILRKTTRLPAEDAVNVCRAASQPHWAVCLWLRCLFFFFFFYLRRLLHTLYMCQQISVCGASVIDYTQPCCFFCFASLWNVLSILHLYLHPRCSCHFYFQNLWFFGRNPLDGQILQCPHDEGRLLLGEQWSTSISLLIQRCKRRCSTSSRLSFSFGSLQNSDVHERDLESCLQGRHRESLRQDALHDESASPPASESRRSRILQPRKADGVLSVCRKRQDHRKLSVSSAFLPFTSTSPHSKYSISS